MTDKIADRMQGAKDMAKGTMAMWVQFDTDDEVAAATEWMKGKHNVKNLTPMTADAIRKAHTKARKDIAARMGIKE